MQHDAQIGPHGVDIGARTVLVAHPVAERVLDAQRGEVEALERASVRGAVDAQRLARRDPVRPRHAARQLVQVALVAVRTLGDLDQAALREPALEIEHHDLVRVAGERDAAARRAHAAVRQQRSHLGLEQRLGAGGAGKKERQGHR